jgi:hypothetical protein
MIGGWIHVLWLNNQKRRYEPCYSKDNSQAPVFLDSAQSALCHHIQRFMSLFCPLRDQSWAKQYFGVMGRDPPNISRYSTVKRPIRTRATVRGIGNIGAPPLLCQMTIRGIDIRPGGGTATSMNGKASPRH